MPPAQGEGGQEELEKEDLHYTRMMNELRNLKEIKSSCMEQMREHEHQGEQSSEEQKKITQSIKHAMREKDILTERLQSNMKMIEDKVRKADQFKEDIVKM